MAGVAGNLIKVVLWDATLRLPAGAEGLMEASRGRGGFVLKGGEGRSDARRVEGWEEGM